MHAKAGRQQVYRLKEPAVCADGSFEKYVGGLRTHTRREEVFFSVDSLHSESATNLLGSGSRHEARRLAGQAAAEGHDVHDDGHVDSEQKQS